MPDAASKIAGAKMSHKERDLRSHLVRLASRYGFLHGTLDVRARTCGKKTCKCTRGEKHSSLYLVVRQDGKVRQLFVPKEKESEVRQWVERYQQILELIDEISDFHWSRIKERED
jgi:DNA-dependent RNA polymerase auxiliary subunit epsilon